MNCKTYVKFRILNILDFPEYENVWFFYLGSSGGLGGLDPPPLLYNAFFIKREKTPQHILVQLPPFLKSCIRLCMGEEGQGVGDQRGNTPPPPNIKVEIVNP